MSIGYLGVDGQRHDEHGDHDVGHREREDEVVGQRAQLLLADNTHTHEQISEDSEQRKDAQQKRPVARRRRRLLRLRRHVRTHIPRRDVIH